MEDLVRYLDEFVEPTIKEFEANPTSVRHAFLACVATFHAIDYLAHPRIRPAHLRQKFRKTSAEFAIVDDVAHAFKHVIAGNPQNPNLKVEQVIARPPAHYGVAVWGLSRWNDSVGGVTLDSEHGVDVLFAVRATVKFLREYQQY